MNVQEYIASGIIEQIVTGLASESELSEFERLCAQYPELVAARETFEKQLENFALENAVRPPVGVKGRFLEAIGNKVSPESSSTNQPKIITMENENGTVRTGGWLRFVAAAAVILVIGLAWFTFRFQSENKELASRNDTLKARLTTTDSILNQIVAEQKVVSDPNTTVVNMVGTTVAPKSSANIYWDSTSTNVFLVVKNMPMLPSDQQYQLWALIDGKSQPKDLGVFDADTTNNRVILKMKNTQKAQAFAITIEQKGGSPSPTLKKMQSLGKMTQIQ